MSQKPQSLHWLLRVLLQWLNFRQKRHSTCEFNKTWHPLFRAAVLEEARLSNNSLDALDGVYITYTTALLPIGPHAPKIHIQCRGITNTYNYVLANGSTHVILYKA